MSRLYRELLEQSNKIKANFFVPGHKKGRAVTALGDGFPFLIDLTELDGTDNLMCPSGILKDAQERAAAVFGAKQTFFLLNGSTVGLETAILGATKRGDKILIDRCAHRSVISAVILGGLEPIFVEPHFDAEREIYRGVLPAAIENALRENPDAAGAVLTSPSYFGVCSPISEIAAILHALGKFLIVDEAHGAHFKFSKKLPKTAIECGADASVISAHKTLPCPTQCSLLHISKTSRIDGERVFDRLKLLQTTSPSYALMAALDNSITEISDGRLSGLLDKTALIPKRLSGGVTMLENDDPTRLVFDVSKLNRTGADTAEELRKRFGIYTETADNRYIVCVSSIGNTDEEFDLLIRGLNSLERRECSREKNIPLPSVNLAMPPHAAYDKDVEKIPAEEAVGRVCGEIVSVCPPGAAILIPGQIIGRYASKRLAGQRIKVLK